MSTVVPSLSGKERLGLELLTAKQDRMYGLELVAEGGGQLKRGTVYVLLGRTQQKGYVETEPEKHSDDSGLVPRRMYRATAHGLRVLRAFIKAIALTVVLPYGTAPLKSRLFGWLRLVLAIPAALAITLAVHLGVGRELSYLVYRLGGPKEALYGEVWLVKVLVSPFMSAALFWTLYLFAPRARRRPAAVGALALVGLWGTLGVTASVMPWPRFDGWIFSMGLALWLGGALSYWAARRRWRAEAVSGLDAIAAQVTHGSDR